MDACLEAGFSDDDSDDRVQMLMTAMTRCDDDDGDDANVLTGDVITENARSNDVATRAEEPFQVGLVFGRITIVQLFFITIAQCLRLQ